MTTRNLSSLFTPRSIALIGASNQPGSVGAVVSRNLLAGGFAGPTLLVNPHDTDMQAVRCYRSVADLPCVPDLAIIATPPAAVPSLIADLGRRGCRPAVVIPAGFDRTARAAMLAAARPDLLRVTWPIVLAFCPPWPASTPASPI